MKIMIAENEAEIRVKTPYNIDFARGMRQLGAERKNEYGMSFWSICFSRREEIVNLVTSIWGEGSYSYSCCEMV